MKMTETPIPVLDLSCTSTQTPRDVLPLNTGELSLPTHTSSCLLESWLIMTYTHTYILLIACPNAHTPFGAFLFLTYRSVSRAHMQYYMHHACLFHQCGIILFRDYHIPECAVISLGVVHPFSNFPTFL